MVLHDEKYYIDRVKAGDKEAFAWLVDRYRDMIYTVCLRMLNSEADAEEAAQDAFVKAYRGRRGGWWWGGGVLVDGVGGEGTAVFAQQ